jgi:uncharacterized protein (TIGR00661 family)
MKYLFFVQNEGRGHLTQALTVATQLRNLGHEISGVVLSNNPERKLPEFFKEQINAPLYFISSPYFLKNKKNTGVDMARSIVFNLTRLNKYYTSAKFIKKLCKQENPDILLNFYEPVLGVSHLIYKNLPTTYNIGHQFFLSHPSFKKPAKEKINFVFLSIYNRLVSYGSKARLALSFTEESDLPNKKIIVCPPLIRPEITRLTPENKNFILSYILNDGYCQEIIAWAQKNPQQKIEAFWDKKNEPAVKNLGSNLTFHQISGPLFLELLRTSSAYVSTAGFESICEAAYLQKDILMVPSHYEQLCNATDAKRAGLAQTSNSFDIELVLNNKNQPSAAKATFKKWVDSQSHKLIDVITS